MMEVDARMVNNPRMGEPIESAAFKNNNVYIKSQRGVIWRVWLENGIPVIERVEVT